jgi:catechol 2,3-dioxygenase-like lactoylglutathione lyase family enzyme
MTNHRRQVVASGLAGVALALLASCAGPAKPMEVAVPEGPLVRGIAYVGQSVSDIDRTTAFYQSAAALSVVDEREPGAAAALRAVAGSAINVETRLLRGATGQIRLMQFKSPSAAAKTAGIVPVQGPGITHVCHQSPDDKGLFAKFVATGAKPVSRTGELVQLRPDVPVRYAYLRDQDGTMFETEQLVIPGLTWTYRMRHVAIVVADIDRTVAFYTALLGREPRERRSNLVNKTLDITADLDNLKLDVAWYNLNNLELEIWEYLNHPVATPTTPRPLEALGYNMIVLDVSNADLAAAKLVEAGGALVAKAAPMDGGRMAFGRDPDGNLIGLFEIDAASPYSATGLGKLENG